MQKLVSSGKSAMDKILEGVNLIADPVKSTISPMGRTVIIAKSDVQNYESKNYPIEVTKDGYKVTQSIRSSDPEIQVGASFIQEVAEKQSSCLPVRRWQHQIPQTVNTYLLT